MTSPQRLGRAVAVAGMVASGSLAVAKIVIGLMAGSTSVVADGIESAGDVLASGVVLFGLVVAAKPPDANHPYGHGRLETLSGLAVGIMLAATGGGICYHSLSGISERHVPPAAYAVWPLIASIVTKTVLSVVKFRCGRRIGSAALVADAMNDSVDILSGCVALGAVTITLSDPGRFLAADHFGGFGVGAIVVYLGLRVIRETTMQLIDTMPEAKKMDALRSAAVRVPGVLGVEKCFARKTGLQYHVDLHLEVDPDMTVRDSHEIARSVRQELKQSLDWVADVLVHVEPHGLSPGAVSGEDEPAGLAPPAARPRV